MIAYETWIKSVTYQMVDSETGTFQIQMSDCDNSWTICAGNAEVARNGDPDAVTQYVKEVLGNSVWAIVKGDNVTTRDRFAFQLAMSHAGILVAIAVDYLTRFATVPAKK